MEKLLLSQVEAARLLGRDRATVRRWTREGVIPTFKDPNTGTILYPLPALRKWLEDMASTARAS